MKDVFTGAIITCQSLVKSFEKFEEKRMKDSYENIRDNIAICNIDGSFTNDIGMPELSEEKTLLKTLWVE